MMLAAVRGHRRRQEARIGETEARIKHWLGMLLGLALVVFAVSAYATCG